MSYATNADIQERLGTATYIELTDDTGSGQPDEDKVTEARLAAEAEIDSYLGRRFAVPIDAGGQPVLAAMLKRLTLDLAEYRLRMRRSPVAEDARLQCEAALLWLSRAASGEVALPTTIELSSNSGLGPAAETAGGKRLLTGEGWEAV
ncbi:MAG: gp436 family protein [Phycisphaerae bacterium]